MPITFVPVGGHWVNLELVTSIELVEDPKQVGQISSARVHYTTGKHQDFKVPAEIKDLRDFLQAHKAT